MTPKRENEQLKQDGVDALWLETLERIVARAAHEVKGALNGVSVNLEVVRSRAEKADNPVSSVSPFATSASGQLGMVISMTEALLALARPMHEPVDVALLVRRFGALLGPAAKAEGVELRMDPVEEATVRVGATTVRIVVGSILLAAVDAGGGRVGLRGGDAPCLRVESGGPLRLEEDIVQVARNARIRMDVDQSGISISFPRDGGRAVDHS